VYIHFSIYISDQMQDTNIFSVDLTCYNALSEAWCIFLKMGLYV